MARNKVRLHATQGSDEANWSGSSTPYRVDNDGSVEVDEEAVPALLEKGGFILDALPPVEVPHGSIRVAHVSDPGALCAHAGAEFVLEADGTLIVPVEAVFALGAHGFRPVPAAAPEAAEVAEPMAAADTSAEPAAVPTADAADLRATPAAPTAADESALDSAAPPQA